MFWIFNYSIFILFLYERNESAPVVDIFDTSFSLIIGDRITATLEGVKKLTKEDVGVPAALSVDRWATRRTKPCGGYGINLNETAIKITKYFWDRARFCRQLYRYPKARSMGIRRDFNQLILLFFLKAQYNVVNEGRCGECGDEWSLERPRPNEEGGPYSRGIIANKYTAGDVISKRMPSCSYPIVNSTLFKR